MKTRLTWLYVVMNWGLNKSLACEIRRLLLRDDVLSVFTLSLVIRKFRLILSWRNDGVNSNNFNHCYVFLIDENNPVVAVFCVKMGFSSVFETCSPMSEIHKLLETLKTWNYFCNFNPWWRHAVQLTESLSPELQSITFHCFLPRSCCITS